MNVSHSSKEIAEYKNPDVSMDLRVADLLKRMTLEEKIAQMVCIWQQKYEVLVDEDGNLDYEKVKKHLKNGIGQIARLSDTSDGKNPVEMAEAFALAVKAGRIAYNAKLGEQSFLANASSPLTGFLYEGDK